MSLKELIQQVQKMYPCIPMHLLSEFINIEYYILLINQTNGYDC